MDEVMQKYPFLFEKGKPIGYTYRPGELEALYSQNIRIRQVIAGCPYTKGNGQCTLACDVDNHHIHTYCNRCKKNLPYGTTVHKCQFTSKDHSFVMDPRYLVNEPWWTEPLLVQQANAAVHLRHLQRLRSQSTDNIN